MEMMSKISTFRLFLTKLMTRDRLLQKNSLHKKACDNFWKTYTKYDILYDFIKTLCKFIEITKVRFVFMPGFYPDYKKNKILSGLQRSRENA